MYSPQPRLGRPSHASPSCRNRSPASPETGPSALAVARLCGSDLQRGQLATHIQTIRLSSSSAAVATRNHLRPIPKRAPFISPSSPFHHSPRDRSSSSRCPLLVFCSRMRGEFMQHEITLNWILPDNATDSEWIILYHIPANCEQTCENVLYSLNQGYQALGKLQGKAHPVAVRTADSTISTDKLKSQFPYVQIIEQQANQQQTISQLSSDHIYLVDPFGKVILRYQAKAQKQEMIMTTKDWISDLKRLLKYSRTS